VNDLPTDETIRPSTTTDVLATPAASPRLCATRGVVGGRPLRQIATPPRPRNPWIPRLDLDHITEAVVRSCFGIDIRPSLDANRAAIGSEVR
jgi:hypothetical protein